MHEIRRSHIDNLRDSKENSGILEHLLFDAEKKPICRVQYSLEQNGAIITLLLIGPDGQVDILDLCNTEKAKIFIHKDPKKKDCYRKPYNSVECFTLETPLGLAALFHELGHAQQSNDPRFKNWYDHVATSSLSHSNLKFLTPQFILELTKFYQLSLFEKEDSQGMAMLDEMLGLATISQAAQYRAAEINRLLFTDNSVTDKAERMRLLREEALCSTKVDEVNRRYLVLYPTLLKIRKKAVIPIERDATKRAFLWMRFLKQKKGIDLFVPVSASLFARDNISSEQLAGYPDLQKKHLEALNIGVINIQDALNIYLATHEAIRQ